MEAYNSESYIYPIDEEVGLCCHNKREDTCTLCAPHLVSYKDKKWLSVQESIISNHFHNKSTNNNNRVIRDNKTPFSNASTRIYGLLIKYWFIWSNGKCILHTKDELCSNLENKFNYTTKEKIPNTITIKHHKDSAKCVINRVIKEWSNEILYTLKTVFPRKQWQIYQSTIKQNK